MVKEISFSFAIDVLINWSILFILFLLSTESFAQDQRIADSLKLLDYEDYGDSTRYAILKEIAFNETNPEIKKSYADLLIAEAASDSSHTWMMSGYLQKGNASRLLGDFEDALSSYFNGLNSAFRIDDMVGVGALYISIADVYSVSGNPKNSSLYYNRGIKILKEVSTDRDDSVSLATALLNAGDEYFNRELFDSALLFFEESGYLFESVEYLVGKAYNLGNIGLVYANTNQQDQAEQNINLAVQILEDLEDYYPISVYLTYMADIYLQKGDDLTALNYALRSLELAQKYGLKEQISDANLKLSELYEETGNNRESLSYFKDYIRYRDSVNNIESVQRMADLRTEFEVSQKQLEVDLLAQQKRNQQLIGVGLIVILILSAVLVVVLYKNNQRRKRTNLELATLNQTKDKFFSIISHDLRGPISAFQGISSIIRMYLDQRSYDKLEEMTEEIDGSASSISDLLDNLLNWAVQQKGEFPYNPEKVNINDLFETVGNTFKASAKAKGIELKVDSAQQLDVWADKNSLRTIIRNLTGNAIKFTPTKGEINLISERNNGTVVLRIKDSGIGIPEHKMETLFQLKDKKSTYGTSGEKGIGLGLQLVYELTQLNKGTISVESKEGEGTTFTVSLQAFRN